jgi:two-component system chemotaxis response regulator CheY
VTLDSLDVILSECRQNPETNGWQHNRLAHKVLLVDDSMFVRQTFSRYLTAVGYEIAGEAVNGDEAIKKFIELRPSVITMDITMPVKDGIEAVEAIMGLDNTARICMVSAMGYQNMVRDAILKGAKNFVVKPVTIDNLKKFLTTIKKVAGF